MEPPPNLKRILGNFLGSLSPGMFPFQEFLEPNVENVNDLTMFPIPHQVTLISLSGHMPTPLSSERCIELLD